MNKPDNLEVFNNGEFSHAYQNGIDEQPGIFLYFNNVYTLTLGIPQKGEVLEEMCICISVPAYQKLREFMINNPMPPEIGF